AAARAPRPIRRLRRRDTLERFTMQTKDKEHMTVAISDLAKEFGLVPGQVYGVLNDLGVEHDFSTFETDADSLELIRGELPTHKGSKELVLQPNRTPRDIAAA